MPQSFYRAFEDRYRGSRELIKSRLTVYLPFVLPLKQFGTVHGIDLGCGRGEWLQLLQENGVEVNGVDLDQNMLAATRELGLNVRCDDAISSLQALGADSQMVVSGFHIAEHLSFELLQTLIQESLRVLKPGGLLILETPNPENIVVGTSNFYLDPTHQRPLPSLLLSFMVEYAGFERVKVLRLQEPQGIDEDLSLMQVFSSVSPDYAVVAQKGGADDIAVATALAFAVEYGVSLENLAHHYEQHRRAEINRLDSQLAEIQASLHKTFKTETSQISVQLHETQGKLQEAEARTQKAEAAALAMRNSASWKLTRPLRALAKFVKKLLSA